jgi:hypothetical protein
MLSMGGGNVTPLCAQEYFLNFLCKDNVMRTLKMNEVQNVSGGDSADIAMGGIGGAIGGMAAGAAIGADVGAAVGTIGGPAGTLIGAAAGAGIGALTGMLVAAFL